jgi:hypothetical protein
MKFAEINITQKKGNCLIKDHHSLRISSTLDIKNNTNNFIANLATYMQLRDTILNHSQGP